MVHEIDMVVSSLGFEENKVDQWIYLKVSGRNFIFLVLYVDDILLIIVILVYFMIPNLLLPIYLIWNISVKHPLCWELKYLEIDHVVYLACPRGLISTES